MRPLGRLPAIGAAFLIVAAGGLVAAPSATPARAASLPPVPAAWPASAFELGITSHPGEAAGQRDSAPFRFRYQYLAGGVNTGSGWATWNADGTFVSRYVAESAAAGMVSVFPYYQLLQSNPQTGLGEAAQDLAHLDDPALMTAYWADVRLFFTRAAGSAPVILHVEPDLWGYVQQASGSANDASAVRARVGSLGIADLAGLPDTVAGFAAAFRRLRDAIAPNVLLAYHLSDWGTGIDLHLSATSDAQTDALAAKAAAFYRSIGTAFDVTFADIADRDAGFKQHVYGDGGRSWWGPADFSRYARFYAGYGAGTGQRTVVWQIPLGNTLMRAMDDTWGHYRDNRAEWWLEDATNGNLALWRDAGVLALLFGGGATGTTCACDAQRDGVTDPAAGGTNVRASLSGDDDGGYFRDRAAAYYRGGALPLVPGGGGPTPTPTPVPTATPAISWSTSATVSPGKVAAGSTTPVVVTVSVRASAATSALVDVELYDPKGRKVRQAWWDAQAFAAGATRTFSVSWSAPATPTGTYRVKVGAFVPAWGPMLAWNDAAASLSVTRR